MIGSAATEITAKALLDLPPHIRDAEVQFPLVLLHAVTAALERLSGPEPAPRAFANVASDNVFELYGPDYEFRLLGHGPAMDAVTAAVAKAFRAVTTRNGAGKWN